MTKKYLLIALLVACFSGLFVVVNRQQTPKSQVVAQTQSQYINEDELWTEVNNWRKLRNYSVYKKNDNLCRFTDIRLSETINDWNHNGFSNVADAITKETGLTLIAENIQKDESDPHKALFYWLQSESHRKNLEANFTDSCIKCRNNYCVQLFASY